jgi:hypothetical protein
MTLTAVNVRTGNDRYYGANATRNLSYPHYVSANNRAIDGKGDSGAGLGGGEHHQAHKGALADLAGSVLASLRNHKGKGVQRVNEGSPARWQLAAN